MNMKHKRFAASSAKRDMLCSGAVAMIESLPPGERESGDTIHSRRGTCAHSVGELCLTAYTNSNNSTTVPDNYLSMEIEGVIVDDAIVAGVTEYVNFCKPIIDSCKKTGFVAIEERGDPSAWLSESQNTYGLFLDVMPNELGGTGDLVAGQMWGTLHVVDYKNGVGMVEHIDCPQLLDYVWFALSKYDPEYEFDKVALTIVQPNAFHEQGSCRTWELKPQEVYDWAANKRLPGIESSLIASELLKGGTQARLQFEKYLNPGDEQCKWCPAKTRCSARNNSITENTGIVTTEDNVLLPKLHLLTEQQELAILNNADNIIKLVKAVKTRRHDMAEQGKVTTGWKLVQKRADRRIGKGMTDNLIHTLKRVGLQATDIYEPIKLKSPAQIEISLKNKGVAPLSTKYIQDRYFVRPDIGTNFVLESKPGIPVKPAIEAEFEGLFEDDDLLT